MTLISFKLFFPANVCSLPNLGHLMAMPSYRTRPNIGASVTKWKFASQMPLIVLHHVLFHQRTLAASTAGKELFSLFLTDSSLSALTPSPLIMVKCPGVLTPEYRRSFYS